MVDIMSYYILCWQTYRNIWAQS